MDYLVTTGIRAAGIFTEAIPISNGFLNGISDRQKASAGVSKSDEEPQRTAATDSQSESREDHPGQQASGQKGDSQDNGSQRSGSQENGSQDNGRQKDSSYAPTYRH